MEAKLLEAEDRYARMRLLEELDSDRLRGASVCVVGVGTLGNELLKNLVLYGPKEVTIVDNDRVERSNLGRCFLFTTKDAIGRRKKVDAAIESLRRINEEVTVKSVDTDVREIESEFFRGFDLVAGCVDNISSRLHLNSHCYFVRTPYIDGGLDGLFGRVQVVTPPDSACYQCTVNASHMALVDRAYRCNGDEAAIANRRIPSEPSVAAITASIQSLEAAKILSGKKNGGAVFIYDGRTNLLENVEAAISGDCDNH